MSQDSLLENNPKTIAIVAGEKSGDELGAPLIQELKKIYPNAVFIGVGGERMEKEGLVSFFKMDEIEYMGLVEPLLNIRKILRLRRNLKKYLSKLRPDIFIGIDAPDFNLPLAKYLKNKNAIKTVQYVSPSVWAWRSGRVKSIESSVDNVFTLFPFEKKAYEKSKVIINYIGHPLADKFDFEIEKKELKKLHGYSSDELMVALLPGSRKSEVSNTGDNLIKASRLIKSSNNTIKFLMPLAYKEHKNLLKDSDDGHIEYSYGNSKDILAMSDFGIITSGTATLEALLLKTPSVVIYKTNWITYKLIKPLLKVSNISLPNLLSGYRILPELLQEDVTPEKIYSSFLELTSRDKGVYIEEFQKIHETLRGGGSKKVAQIVSGLIN
jgi:lipid-A-disaccharide synthase